MRWRKPRPIQLVAIVIAVVAAGSVLLAFGRMSGFMGRMKSSEPVLVASVDLRLGNTLLSTEQGEAEARADIEAGKLQLQSLTPEDQRTHDDEAKARELKRRYNVAWVHRGGTPTPAAHAFVDAYNRVMRAELDRRHGRAAVERLLPGDEPAKSAETRP